MFLLSTVVSQCVTVMQQINASLNYYYSAVIYKFIILYNRLLHHKVFLKKLVPKTYTHRSKFLAA